MFKVINKTNKILNINNKKLFPNSFILIPNISPHLKDLEKKGIIFITKELEKITNNEPVIKTKTKRTRKSTQNKINNDRKD